MNTDRFKFRVWDNDISAYRQTGTVQLCSTGEPLIINGDMHPESIDNVAIEQCTGLRDKNGQLIYEGDVVLVYDVLSDAYNRCVVRWEEAAGMFFGVYLE